ncbi:hypothetical protein [Arthrobacter caoxuetaonis]|uniref:Nucleotide-diphospho-sugar transferase n=1 Tax=Arthrobacter caoxuetaonis TaxID=2886935 RepID=A0A9X1MDW7_9MICC|nr:hypothetical protein [Arthrobacter caoxuetaonis]MCC3297587.1 hypothetical protein [Arthrobacter caoxuetaonis]USQ56203.1 hypothetical protein NF551_10580 [Arthrobacter caoxuetaonis]
MDQQFKRPQQKTLAATAQYYRRLRGVILTDEYRYFDAALSLTASALESGIAAAASGDQTKAMSVIEAVRREYTFQFGGLVDSPEAVAFHVLAGQLLSLTDREAAGYHFTNVQRSEYRRLVPLFYWDSGATTYYTHDTVNTQRARDDMKKALAAPISLRRPVTDNTTVIAISVDKTFFRIYIGWFLFYAQQLPEIDFAIYICAPAEEARTLVEDGDRFIAALSNLNSGSTPSNLAYYGVSTPDFVNQERTYYACVRFYALPHLLARYDNAYLVDADLYFENDPGAFLKKVRDYTFGTVVNEGLIALPPWRRNMAGNVVANRSVLSTNLLDDLLTYISHGLKESTSWMLDQNAITYAVERAGPAGGVRSLNGAARPTVASKFMTRWEKNFTAART